MTNEELAGIFEQAAVHVRLAHEQLQKISADDALQIQDATGFSKRPVYLLQTLESLLSINADLLECESIAARLKRNSRYSRLNSLICRGSYVSN